jgi:hypothetical protein
MQPHDGRQEFAGDFTPDELAILDSRVSPGTSPDLGEVFSAGTPSVDTDPAVAAAARRVIDDVLAEHN